MPTFYLDYQNGTAANDTSETIPLGWWKVAFDNGTGNAPSADDACTGATSGHHGHLTVVGTITGSWAGNNAAGFLYFYGCDDLLHSGEQIDWHDGHCHATAAAVYCAWKTITAGALAARIAPADIIRIAKSPAPTILAGATGHATWTSLSKTVTLADAQTLTICQCENSNWTGANDGTGAVVGVATDAKQGSYCQKVTMDAATQANKLQAYWATGTIAGATLNGYQKLTFWFKNSAVVADATTWYIALCSVNNGTGILDTFPIPAIPSTARWIPLTIYRCDSSFVQGGNLGGNASTAVESIAIYSGATAPTNSCNVLMDNFEACTSAGLNLQSLISKNTLEQGSASAVGYANEGWYGIQSIVGTTVLLDTGTNTKANVGEEYSTSGTTPETVDTYFRETIKTALGAAASTVIQEVQDSGTIGSNIEFQGGYDTGTNSQTGETFFDGLNGNGYGLRLSSKSYITLNYLNFSRYNYGVIFSSSSSSNTITTLTNANNNTYGVAILSSNNNTITTLTNANNNSYGVYFTSSSSNTITTLTNANNNTNYGVYFTSSNSNTIRTLNTTGNATAATYNINGKNYIGDANLAEGTDFAGTENYGNSRLQVNYLASTGYSYIYTDYGNIVSQAATAGGTGTEWKLSVTDVARNSNYPLKLSIARIAVAANANVDISVYIKKSHGSDIGAKLVCMGGQLAGIATDVTTTAPSDTTRNSVALATMLPTEAGVLEIEVWAYWLANAADENVIVDDITITQA